MYSLLYIDDEPGLLELGKLFLEGDREFRVTTALSGPEGLALMEAEEFDAVVSDYLMPEMNGLELLKRVRQSHASVPFILFTGRGREEVVIEAINNGADFYLQKGGDPKAQFAELSHKVRQAVTRRKAEAALSDSERRLADIIDFLPDATFAIDTAGVVIAWNRAMEKMTSTNAADVLGRGDYEYALPFYHERRPLLIDLVLRDDPAIGKRYPFVKREGKTLFSEITIPHFNNGRGAALWFTASPLYDRKGNLVGAIESIREITERKRAEEELVAANREYTNLLDQIQDVYYRTDSEGRLVKVSRSWATLFGYDDVAECIGKNMADDFYFNPSDRKPVLDELSRSGKITAYRVRLKKRDGTPVLIEANSHLYHDPAGRVIGVEGTFRDVTERQMAEDALNESERRFRELADLLPQGVFETDIDAQMVYVNQHALEMFGYTPDDIRAGLKVETTVAPDDRERVSGSFHRMIDEGIAPAGSIGCLAQRKDGQVFPAAIYSSPIARDGKIVGVRGIIMDVTERTRAENELRSANERLTTSGEELRAQYDELALGEQKTRISEARLKFMLGFYDFAQKSEKELLENAIEGAAIVTGSSLAYLAFLNDDETELAMYAWSRSAMKECAMQEKPIIYPVNRTGLWGEAVRQRRPVITNDYAAPNPAKKGYPEGHPHIVRHMNIPVIDEGHIVIVTGVANKPSDYTEEDAGELMLLMRGLWNIIKRRRAEAAHKAAFERVTAAEEELRRQVDSLAAAQAEIVSQKQQLEEIASLIPGVVYQFYARPDGSRGLYYASTRTEEIFGIGTDLETFFPRFTAGVHPGDREAFIGSIEDAIREKTRWHFEGRFIRPSGESLWFEGISSPAARGSEIVFTGVILDITERKVSEEALREREAKFRAVIDQSFQFIGLMDTGGTLLEANRSSLEFAGIREPDVINRPFWETPWWTYSTEMQEKVRDAIRRAASGETVRFEAPLAAADGHLADFDFSLKPVRDSEGTIRYLIPEARDISALRHAEEELRLLKISVDRSSDEVFWMDFSGNILYVNDAACRITGYSREEFLTMKLSELDPDIRPDSWDERVADLREKKTRFFTTRHRRRDGEIIDVEILAVYVSQDDREYSFAFVRDITERMRTEQALARSEAMLWSILHGSPVLQFVIDRSHRIISWNKALEEYSGVKAEDVIGTDQQWRAFYAEKRPVLADLLVDGDTGGIERWYPGKIRSSRYVEGAYEATDFFPQMGSTGTWLSFTAAPIRDRSGTVIGAVETLEDVTERINAENRLRESSERTRTILDTVQAGIVLVDAADHRIVDANKKALELIGLDRETVIGSVCNRFICPAEEGKCPVTDFGQAVDTSERTVISAGGEKIPVLKTVVPLTVGGKNLLVESFVDISGHKRSEAAIREANRKLNLLNSVTRHDIRNQLTVAQGYTQLATMAGPDAAVLDYIAKIAAAIETIQLQIEFTKTYQELGVHAPSWFRVSDVIRNVRPVHIGLTTTCGAVEIFADPMIDKVFFNLFDNAGKHGGSVTAVTAGCRKGDDGSLIITFADNGTGIPVAEKHKIFEKGFGRNTGLGLFLVREILAITGMTITETGKAGEGAVFEITVPEGAYRNAE